MSAIFAGLFVPGCKRGEETKPAVVSEPVVKCLPMPAAYRAGIRKGADNKTLLFYEDLPDKKMVLHALDIETLKSRMIGEKTGFATVLPNGTIVYTKEDHLYLLKKGETQRIQIGPVDDLVTSVAIEPTTSSIVYIQAPTSDKEKGSGYELRPVYKTNSEGNEPQKIGEATKIVGPIPGEKAVIIGKSKGSVARLPLDGGAETTFDIGTERIVASVIKGYLITVPFRDFNADRQLVPLAGGPPVDLQLEPGMNNARSTYDGESMFLSSFGPNGAIYRIDGPSVAKVLTVKGPRITQVTSLPNDIYVVMASHDTNGNHFADITDEADICIIERHGSDKVLEIPTRNVPFARVSLADKLAPILSDPDLAGAELTFEPVEEEKETFKLFADKDKEKEKDTREMVAITSPKEGGEDLAVLRKRVRDIQARVNELAGADAKLGVRVRYPNGLLAESLWIPARGRYLSYAGIGSAMTAEPSEYDIDLSPEIAFGPVICSGKVKNLGQTPLEKLLFTCKQPRMYEAAAQEQGPLSPSRLAPGATGTYRVRFPDANSKAQITFEVTSDGKLLSYYNSYASDKAVKVTSVASKVFMKTGLRFDYNRTISVPGEDRVLLVVTRGSEAFDNLGADEQKARAEQVLKELGDAVAEGDDGQLARKLEIRPLDPSIFAKRKTFANGKFTESLNF